MHTEYLHPYTYAAARSPMAGHRNEATPAPADIIARAGQLAHRLLADPVGERLTQQLLVNEQLLQHRR